jgi:biotin operon repressor
MREAVQNTVIEAPKIDAKLFPRKMISSQLNLEALFRAPEPSPDDFLITRPEGWTEETANQFDWYDGQINDAEYNAAYRDWENREDLRNIPADKFMDIIKAKLIELNEEHGISDPRVDLSHENSDMLCIKYRRNETEEEYLRRYKNHIEAISKEALEKRAALEKETAAITAKLQKLKESGIDISALMKEHSKAEKEKKPENGKTKRAKAGKA